MQVRYVSSLAALGAAVAGVLALASFAHADEFSEYRIPAQSYQSGSGQFGWSASRWRSGSQSGGTETQNVGAFGSASGSFRRGFDSDPRGFSWTVRSGWTSDVSHDQRTLRDPSYVWSDRDDRDQAHTQSASLASALRLNPGGGVLGFEFDAGVSGDWAEGWSREDSWNQYLPTADQAFHRNSTQRHLYGYTAQLSAAAGLGRVRYVSVVEDVHIMEERLREAGVLVRPLSAGARAKLARVLAAAGVISNAHDRAERYRWREIERVFAEDGALGPGGFDAWAVQRASEGVVGRVYRSRGHFVGLVVQAQHDHDIQRSEFQDGHRYVPGVGSPAEYREAGGRRDEYEFNRAYAGVRARWHRPVGWAWQWDATAEALTPVRPGEQGWSSSAQLGASWHVADRWLASARSYYSRRYFAPRDVDLWVEDHWSAQQSLRLEYFLEDHLSLSVSLDDLQDRGRMPDALTVTSDRYQHYQRLSAGLGWRFLGRAEAPGLFGPMSASD